MYAVTCRTVGCANEGYTLILTEPGHTIVCGPCGQYITSVEPVVPVETGSEPDGEEPEDPEEIHADGGDSSFGEEE